MKAIDFANENGWLNLRLECNFMLVTKAFQNDRRLVPRKNRKKGRRNA